MFTNEQYTYLVEKYIDSIYRIALNYLKNCSDAEDICQNVFIKLLTKKKSFQDEDHLRNWLIRVAINECKMVLCSPWHHRETLNDHIPCISFADCRYSDLYYSLMAIPRHYRIPLYLYYYEGYSTEEVGQLLNLPSSTVRTRLQRARNLLRKALGMEEENV